MFRRISFKVKLISAFVVTVLLVAALSYFNIQAIRQTHNSFSDIVGNHLPRLDLLQNMRVVVGRIDRESSLYESLTKSADIAAQKQALLDDVEQLTTLERDYLALVDRVPEAEKRAVAETFTPVSTAKSVAKDAITSFITLKEQKVTGSVLTQKQAAVSDAEQSLDNAIKIAIDKDFTNVTIENDQINANVQQTVTLAITLSTLTSVFAIVIGIAISLSFASKVKKLKEGAARLAGGDFSSQIILKTNDELGQLAASFNQMSSSLRSSYLRLALEKERDETLLESMSEGMIALDENGNIVLINSVASALLELPAQAEITGKAFTDAVRLFTQEGYDLTPEGRPTSTLHSGVATNTVFGFLTKAKRKMLINIASSPVKLEDRIAGAIFVLRDVTKEKEVDRMKTEFISLPSHQLRTPLSAIKWFSEMLLNGDAGELKPEQLDFTKNIADSTDRMVDLVNSLLNISRIESGRIIVDPHPTDLQQLITGIVNDLKAKTEERQQTLVISVHSDLPKINLDPRLISQVYLNLLTNAIKYTPKKGEISVFISKKGEDIISQVTDNGYGIPKAQQGRIFQKFFRAENVAKVETDGTGLGLYLIKAIVESSGGKIWFESEEGKGTSFWFTIPVSGMKRKEGEVTLDG